MDPLSKGPKLSVETDIKQQQDNNCVDRISNLPPDLVGKILSLLPSTKEAVASSVLSSRWKWFWTFITRLDFDFVDFRQDSFKSSFTSLVCRVLVFRKAAALDYFRVTCRAEEDISHLRAWVSAALLVDVKELSLYIGVLGAMHVLPFDLFSSKKLVKLRLGGYFRINVPTIVCLPSLEVLSLGAGFRDEDSLRRLLTGCPALEELEIDRFYPDVLRGQELFSCRKLAKLKLRDCSLMNVPSLVSLPSLQALDLYEVIFPDDDSAKRLLCGCPSLQKLHMGIKNLKVLHVASPILSNLTITDWGYGVGCGKVVLETPSLQYLKVSCMSLHSFELLTDLNHLMEADVEDIHSNRPYEVMTDLITGISNVKTLHLCGVVMEVLLKSGCELPKLQNLTTLKLRWSNDVGWALLPDLLEKSPFLEMLIFEWALEEHEYREEHEYCEEYEYREEYEYCEEYEYGLEVQEPSVNATWHAPQKVPYCLLHHLNVIQLNDFKGDIEKEEMIQYLIESRRGLKDLTIQYSSRSGNYWEMNVGKGQ